MEKPDSPPPESSVDSDANNNLAVIDNRGKSYHFVRKWVTKLVTLQTSDLQKKIPSSVLEKISYIGKADPRKAFTLLSSLIEKWELPGISFEQFKEALQSSYFATYVGAVLVFRFWRYEAPITMHVLRSLSVLSLFSPLWAAGVTILILDVFRHVYLLKDDVLLVYHCTKALNISLFETSVTEIDKARHHYLVTYSESDNPIAYSMLNDRNQFYRYKELILNPQIAMNGYVRLSRKKWKEEARPASFSS